MKKVALILAVARKGNAEADERPAADRRRQRGYAVRAQQRLDRILRRSAGMGSNIFGDAGAIGRDRSGMRADPGEDRLQNPLPGSGRRH